MIIGSGISNAMHLWQSNKANQVFKSFTCIHLNDYKNHLINYWFPFREELHQLLSHGIAKNIQEKIVWELVEYDRSISYPSNNCYSSCSGNACLRFTSLRVPFTYARVVWESDSAGEYWCTFHFVIQKKKRSGSVHPFVRSSHWYKLEPNFWFLATSFVFSGR